MILGIGGKAGSGKSTAVSYLETRGFEEIELAGNMKRTLSYLLDIPLSHFYDQEIKNKELEFPIIIDSDFMKLLCSNTPFFWENDYSYIMDGFENKQIICNSYRELLQKFGTDILRNAGDENVHINWGLSTAKQKDDIVFQAVRFPNEFDYVYKMGGYNIYIERKEISSLSGDAGNHASENSVKKEDFDFIVENNHSLDYLYFNIEHVLVTIHNKKEGIYRD